MLPSFKTLSLAARNGDLEHVRECLNAGVDQNEHPGMPHGLSPLMYASHYGHVEIVRLLAEHGANVDFSDGDSFTAVTIACEQSHWEIVKVLAEFGADFTIANASGLDGHDYLKPSRCRSKKVRDAIAAILAAR